MTDADRMVVWLREAMDAAQRDAEAATPGPWHVTEYVAGSDYGFDAGVGTAPGEVDVVGHGYEGGCCERVEDARHIVRHDPAAVLRRIAADRETLDEHADDGYGECKTCSVPDGTVEVNGIEYEMLAHAPAPCATVRNLAEGYGWTEEEQQ